MYRMNLIKIRKYPYNKKINYKYKVEYNSLNFIGLLKMMILSLHLTSPKSNRYTPALDSIKIYYFLASIKNQ